MTDTLVMGTCQNRTINVVANDTDPEGNLPLALVSIVHNDGMGNAYISGTTSIQFQSFGAAGPAGVIYTVRDSLGATSTGALDIVINDWGGCN